MITMYIGLGIYIAVVAFLAILLAETRFEGLPSWQDGVAAMVIALCLAITWPFLVALAAVWVVLALIELVYRELSQL